MERRTQFFSFTFINFITFLQRISKSFDSENVKLLCCLFNEPSMTFKNHPTRKYHFKKNGKRFIWLLRIIIIIARFYIFAEIIILTISNAKLLNSTPLWEFHNWKNWLQIFITFVVKKVNQFYVMLNNYSLYQVIIIGRSCRFSHSESFDKYPDSNLIQRSLCSQCSIICYRLKRTCLAESETSFWFKFPFRAKR